MVQTGGKGMCEEVIKQLFDEYYEKLCLYAEGIVRDHAVAEDIVEELFIHLWLNSDNIKITPNFGVYLFRSVHNNCLKHNGRSPSSKFKQISELEKEIHESSAHHLPLSMVIASELEAKFEKILNNLPEKCRRIYLMNRYEDKSYSQISEELQISVSTIKTQMVRAFQKMKEGLKNYFD